MPIPAHGRAADEILAQLDEYRTGDVDLHGGRAFTLGYVAGDDVHAIATEALARFHSYNALNPVAFPSLARIQSEVVAMTAGLLHGGETAAGFLTSGGTESLLLAVKAARNRGRERGIDAPEMVVPTSGHAAFTKGSEYFGVKLHRIPVRDDYRADVDAMAAAVNDNTMLVVASAPQYPQGVVDPVEEIAALAAERDINCHVDACMGGITLPYLRRLGYPIPPFDFEVPGVTSISVDLHKYGYTAKGASVLLHRDRQLRKYQTFTTDAWLGGMYASSGILGTKSGGPMAAAWAVMQYLGDDGYLRLTGDARLALEDLLAGLRSTPGVRVLGEPDATVLAFTLEGSGLDTFAVGRALWARGWFCDQQTPPPSLHCTVNAVHRPLIPEFLAALIDAMDEVRAEAAEAEALPYAALE